MFYFHHKSWRDDTLLNDGESEKITTKKVRLSDIFKMEGQII